MAVNLSFIGGAGWQFFDNNGVPLAGGKIYTYAAGTTTPLATYTSRDGLTANANPIVLDSAGRTPAQIWSTEGVLYKYVVETADNIVLRTWDNIGGSVVASDLGQDLANTTNNAKGDALVGFKQSNSSGFLTGAVARTVNAKLQETVSVKDFGAVGDGVTDDTAAIQAALDAQIDGVSTQSSIFLPPGKYRVTDTLTIDRRNVRFFGAGNVSNLYFDPPSTGKTMLLVQNSDPSQVIVSVTLDHFSFSAVYPSAFKKTGIRIIDGSNITLNQVKVLDYSWQGNGDSIALHMSGRDTHQIIDCSLVADQPLYASPNPNSTYYTFDYHHFSGVSFQTLNPDNYAILFAAGVNPSNWIIDGDSGAFTGKGGIYLNNVGTVTDTPSMIVIDGFRVESGSASGGNPGGYGIYMDFGTSNPACGNIQISNCSVNDPTCNGYFLKNVSALIMDNVNCGFGAVNNAVILNNVANARITNLGIGNPAATVQFNNMYAQQLHKFSSKPSSDPSVMFGLYVNYSADTPGNNLVYENGVRKWSRTEVLNNAGEMALPILAAGRSMLVTVSCNYGGAIYFVRYGFAAVLSSTAGFGVAGGGVISLVAGPTGGNKLVNVSAGADAFYVTTAGF